MLQGIFLIPLKPSHAVALENQLHKPPEEQGQVVRRFSYGNFNDAAKLSNPSILVNRKIAEIVIYRNEQRIHAKG